MGSAGRNNRQKFEHIKLKLTEETDSDFDDSPLQNTH